MRPPSLKAVLASCAAAPLIAAAPTAAASTPATVVIDQFAPSGPWGAADEYVELRNAGDTAVDLHGWSIAVCAPNYPSSVITFVGGPVVGPGERLTLANREFSGPPPNMYYSVDVPENGGWRISDRSRNVADTVGLDYNSCVKGAPASQCDWYAGETAWRKGSDLDNAADFTCRPR